MSKDITQEFVDDTTVQQLLTDTKNIASTALEVRQEERTNNKKISVIGTALLDQKEVLSTIVDNQSAQSDNFETYLNASSEKQNDMVKDIVSLSDGLKELSKSDKEQKQFVTALADLQVEHTKIVKATNDHSEKTVANLSSIRDTIAQISEEIKSYDIQDQAEYIVRKTAEIHSKIEAHVESRSAYQSNLSNHIDNLTTGMKEFYAGVEAQTETISAIEVVANNGYNHVKELNDKMDLFLDLHNMKVEQTDLTLEDLFKPQDETVIETEVADNITIEDEIFEDTPEEVVEPKEENPDNVPQYFKDKQKEIEKGVVTPKVEVKPEKKGFFRRRRK